MKTITEKINESKNIKIEDSIDFDVKNDIYNVVSDLAFEYDKANKKFEKKEVEKAFDWFLDKFFDEDDED